MEEFSQLGKQTVSDIITKEPKHKLSVLDSDEQTALRYNFLMKHITLNTESEKYAAVYERYSDNVWNYFVLYILNNPMINYKRVVPSSS